MSKNRKSLFEAIAGIHFSESWKGVAKIARDANVKVSPEVAAKAAKEKAAAKPTTTQPSTSTAPEAPTTSAPTTSSTPTAKPTTPATPATPAPTAATPKKPLTNVEKGALALGTAGLIAGTTGALMDKPSAPSASAEPNKQVPLPPRRPADAAPKPAAAPKPKERFIDTAAIYAKHGVGSNDESPSAFHRAEAEINDLKKANPTHIDPRSSSNYAGRLTQQRADDEAAAAKKSAPAPKAAPTPKAAPAPKAETPAETPKLGPAAPLDASPISPQQTAPGMDTGFKKGTTVTQDIENAGKFQKPKAKVDESNLIAAFMSLSSGNHSNIFEAAKKLKGNQDKLDKNHNGKLDSQDFKMLRGEKVEEEKKADKDYDGDGKVESSKDEVWGSRFKAAKKAGKMEEATSSDPDFAAPRPDGSKRPDDIEYKPEEKKPEEKVPVPPKRPSNLKETYLNMLRGK